MTGCGESAASKSPASRTGPIRSPRPKFEYKAGDKAAHGQYPTEIEILPGDTVWIAFIGGDPHYSSITGSSSTPVESTSTKPMPSAEYEVKWTPEPSEPIVETYSHIPFAAVRISAEVEASGGGSEGGETRAGADAGAGRAEDTPTVTGYARTPSEALSGLEIVTGAEGVDVSAPNALRRLFPSSTSNTRSSGGSTTAKPSKSFPRKPTKSFRSSPTHQHRGTFRYS